MRKIIKKFFRYLFITIAVFLTVVAISVLVLRTPVFQSYIVKQFSAFISKKVGTQISIGKVSYTYFNKLIVYDLLIMDQNNDTLLATQQLSLKIREFNPASNRYKFGKIDIYQPDFRMITDTTGMLNLRWYLDLLGGKKEKDTTQEVLVSIADINLYDGSYRLINRRDTTKQKEGLIDFSNLEISAITGHVGDFNVCNDSVSFQVNKVAFNESSGISARDVNISATFKGEDLYFSNVKIVTDSSLIIAPSIYLLPNDSIGFNDFINKVRINILLDRSSLSTADLSHFTAVFKGIKDSFYASGHFYGTIAELNGRKAEIEYGSETRLKCDFDLSGLPEIENTFAFFEVTDFRTSAVDIERINLPSKKPIILPQVIKDLGRMSYRGNFTGFTTDFVTYGTLKTEKGNFSTDVSFRPDSSNVFKFKGLLSARDVDLSALSGNNKKLGKLWFHADVNGYTTSLKHFTARIIGAIDSVSINDYLYRDIQLKGQITEKIWDGNVKIKDDNIDMNLLGSFDFSGELPEYNFTMNLAYADLYSLKMMKQDTLYKATALITASFKGNNIDNLDGDLRLVNSTMTNSTGEISINNFLVRSTSQNGVPLLTLKSDFADAEISGPHTYASLGVAVRSVMAQLFPTKFKTPDTQSKLKENNFIYSASFKNINKFNDFFSTGLSVADSSTLKGVFHADSSLISLNFKSKQFGIAGCTFGNIDANANVTGNNMNILLLSDAMELPDNSMIKNVSIAVSSHPDTLNLNIFWDNHDEGKTLGEIKATGYVTLNEQKKPSLKINIAPTSTFVSGAQWKINPATIVIDSAVTHINRIYVENGNKFFSLDGFISSNPVDKMSFVFAGLNLSYLNKLNERKSAETDAMEMKFGGILNGYIDISDVKKDLRLESDITIDEFTFNDSPYGKVTVKSEWESSVKAVKINVTNDFQGVKFFDVSGFYKPSGKSINLTAILSRMPLNIINPIIKSFASDARGLGSGKVKLSGKLSMLNLNGAIKAEESSIKVDFLQTRYYFNDSIRFTKKGIEFRNIKIADEKKNQGNINGILYHKGFKDINLDFIFDIKNLMVLNTKPKDSQYFYGTAFATGIVRLKGPTNKLSFDISAKTEKNTSFCVPLNSSATMGEYPYIIFVDNKQINQSSVAQDNMFEKKVKSSGISLNFDLEVTPDAEAQLIMDPKTGDIIKGNGSGKLNIRMDNNGAIKMAGDYVIQKGSYLFTMGNVINKKFSIENGGTISWNGGLIDADLNLRAIYKCETSLYEIFNDPAYKNRIPVECLLILTGKLYNPVVSFDINLPTADNETREYLKMAINTDEELSKQFLYLLVMNSFYPDPSLFSTSSSTQSTTQGANALGVTTTEMLSNQFSNWLSQISNDFDIGFNYRPGNEITTQQVEAAFSTQLLNDKVTFNGNVDVGGKQSSTKASNVTTDFTLEYNITERLKFKAFNRSNDNLLYEMAPYTQGFGILYRHEFDRFRDLIKKSNEEKKKKGDEKK
jgi:hypothetical protein